MKTKSTRDFFFTARFGLLDFAASGFVMGSFMFMSCMFLTARFSSSHCGQFATCPICQPVEQDEGDMEEKEKPVPQFAIYGPHLIPLAEVDGCKEDVGRGWMHSCWSIVSFRISPWGSGQTCFDV